MQRAHATRVWLIPILCLFHMAAVALYLIPYGQHTVLDLAKDMTREYVLLTSQWQKWDIFSPDPLRRVSTYVIEEKRDTEWQDMRIMNFDTLPWWERATELKILSRLEEERWSSVAGYYLRTLCLEDHAHVELRLIAQSFVLPSELWALQERETIAPQEHQRILTQISCMHS